MRKGDQAIGRSQPWPQRQPLRQSLSFGRFHPAAISAPASAGQMKVMELEKLVSRL